MCKVSAKLDNINIRHFIRVPPLNFLSTRIVVNTKARNRATKLLDNNCKAIGTQGMGQLALLIFIGNKRKNGSNFSNDWSKVTYIPTPKPDILGFSYLIRPQHCDSLTNNPSESLIAYYLLLKISKLL